MQNEVTKQVEEYAELFKGIEKEKNVKGMVWLAPGSSAKIKIRNNGRQNHE